MPAVDPVERIIEGVVECLDTAAAITALTTRSSRNVVPSEDLADARSDKKAAIGYLLPVPVIPGRGGIGDWRRVVVQFDAEAAERALAHELLYAIEQTLTAVNLAANATQPLDAFIVHSETSRLPVPSGEVPGAERAALQMTIEVAFP